MVVVITLTPCKYRQKEVVTGTVGIGIRARTKHMTQGVDKEGKVMRQYQTQQACNDECAPNIP